MDDVTIRQLTQADAALWRALRLRMLREHPEAYSSSYEEQVSWPLDRFAERLWEPNDQVSFIVGAFDGGLLVGSCGLARERGLKERHKASITSVYVAPEVRGHGLGRALLQEAIRRARGIEGLEQLLLGVTDRSEAARGLYVSLGFEVYGREPRALKIGDRYLGEDLMVLWLREQP